MNHHVQCTDAISHSHKQIAVAIRNEIEAETMRYLQTKGKVVSADPIQLTVYSPVVPNLTLVDMPGKPSWLDNMFVASSTASTCSSLNRFNNTMLPVFRFD